jgi:hypothetical protein
MPTTAYWAPNQAAVAQVETYVFSAPNSVGNTYTATINGKSVTYASVAGDTAATAATGLFNLLNIAPSTGGPLELTEITFANPSSGVMTATAAAPGTPFANVPGTTLGLVLSTGNGLANGIATAHTQANQSPSDVNDPQNWLRVTGSAPGVRQLPQNGDNGVVANTSVPMLWNLDQLASLQWNTYQRWQSFTGTIGLPENNPNGYTEWRATYFKFVGPQGSVPAGGLQMVLGYNSGSGSGPSRERYNVGSQPTTLICLAAGQPADEWGIRFLGVHTANTFTATNGVSLGIAMLPGEVAGLSSCTIDGGATVGIGAGVVWTAGAVLTTFGGSVIINSAPSTITGSNGTQFTFGTDALTWPTITVQSNCAMSWLCGGIVTTLTMSVGCSLDKSNDGRAMTITNHTIDGDSCYINDPLNAITFTNAGSVKQQVQQGPYRFTGTRTMKLT